MSTAKIRSAYLLIFIVLASIASHAQSFYNTGSTVTVLPGTIFSVRDSLVNTGTLVNNGNLVIGGTWLNTGSYQPGIGEITFNSTSLTSPQIINHSNQSFSKLTISGGGKKLILADMTIEDEIIFTDGIIENENNARVIMKPSVVITGGSDQSHIHAPVYHEGGGEKLYPLGNGSVYLPVRILNIGDPSAVVGVEGIELAGTVLPKAPSLDAISSMRYWRIDATEGSMESQIVLPLRDEVLPGDLSNIVVAESDDLNTAFISAGKSSAEGTAANGMVTSDRAIASSFVTIASASDNGAPIVYNAISVNNDGLNEDLTIGNIEFYPENKFMLFNRWGDKIFEIDNYDNQARVFRGVSNVGGEKELGSGTYFYSLETSTGIKLNGFIVLKR